MRGRHRRDHHLNLDVEAAVKKWAPRHKSPLRVVQEINGTAFQFPACGKPACRATIAGPEFSSKAFGTNVKHAEVRKASGDSPLPKAK